MRRKQTALLITLLLLSSLAFISQTPSSVIGLLDRPDNGGQRGASSDR